MTDAAAGSPDPFGPEIARAMSEAFEAAWKALEGRSHIADGQMSEARAELGRRIFELAQRGEHDPTKLSAYALAMMRL